MTYKEKLLKAFPNATPVREDGLILFFCPHNLGIADWGENCPDVSCCKDCWNQEIENEHNR